METEVIIVGGGCGGLWLFYELLRHNYSCVLVENKQLGSFASTRNQSWLHTGSIYANDPKANLMINTCLKGFADILDFCNEYAPEGIQIDSGCVFLFETEQQRDNAHNRLEQAFANNPIVLNRPVTRLSNREISRIEPILRNTPLQFGLKTIDVPFNSFAILQSIVAKIRDLGGIFRYTNRSLLEVDIRPDNGRWLLRYDNLMLEAPIIVLAAGALSPELSTKTVGHNGDITIQNSLVTVFHRELTKHILSFRTEASGYMILAPFHGGTTLRMDRLDRSVVDSSQFEPWYDQNPDIARQLNFFVPTFWRKHRRTDIHFYVCQKVNNSDHEKNAFKRKECGARHYFWIEDPTNFFNYYPGKFTLAPVGAKRLCQLIEQRLGRAKALHHVPSDIPTVAERPYYDTPTHFTSLSPKGEKLIQEIDIIRQ